MDVAALVLGGQDLDRLVRADPARPVGLVLADEAGKRLADDQADVQRQARLCARGAAGALQRDDMVGVLQHDVPREARRGRYAPGRRRSMSRLTVTSCVAAASVTTLPW